MKATTATINPISRTMAGAVKVPQASFFTLSNRSATPRGSPETMPAKISSDMPLPMPRSVICSPSHMTKTLPVVRVSMVIRMKPGPGLMTKSPGLLQLPGNAQGLHRAQRERQIARPLGNLLASQFAFFLQLGQRLIHHGQQLQNDGRRDVGHDAQGENGQPLELAAGEQIDEAQEAAVVLLEVLLQLVGVHPRRGNVAAQPVHRQQAEREPDALAQVRNAKNVGELLPHYCKTSNLPPALVIFS